MMNIEKIAVLGAGQMGNGITQVAACAGYSVTMIDIKQEFVDRGIASIEKSLAKLVSKERMTQIDADASRARISLSVDRADCADCDLVIEAVPEILDLKIQIFKELDELCKPETILASNTSSISISTIAEATNRPEKVIGMHFMNPVPVMKLVEIIRGYSTTDEVTELIMDLSKKLNKIPVEVNDYPGFVANRILMPMINEAIITLHEGVAGVSEIDTVMKLGMAHPMGPLQLADFIGLDVCLAIMEVLYDGFGNSKYAPCPLLVNMVTAGKLGVKSGEGFYSWGHGTKELIVSDKFKS